MEQFWNFAAIEGCASEIQGYAGTVHGLLDEGTAALGRLQGQWQGTGSESWLNVQTKWNSASTELKAALQNLAMTVHEAGLSMAQAEQHVAGSFSGG